MSGLYAIKPRFVRSLGGIEDRLVRRGVSADRLSYTAVAVSVLAGVALGAGYTVHHRWWLAVGPLVLLRLALNALDGSVARRTGTARPFGKVVNEISDRLSDTFLIAPLVLFIPPLLVVVVLITTFITSACGALGNVVGTGRLTKGPMGKADRCLVLSIAAVIAGLTGVAVAPFFLALVLVAIGGAITILGRLRALRDLAEEAAHVR